MARLATDQEAVDALAALLGTSFEWSSAADYLDDIASILGKVRPHPGITAAENYRETFRAATGRSVPSAWDMTPVEAECHEVDLDGGQMVPIHLAPEQARALLYTFHSAERGREDFEYLASLDQGDYSAFDIETARANHAREKVAEAAARDQILDALDHA